MTSRLKYPFDVVLSMQIFLIQEFGLLYVHIGVVSKDVLQNEEVFFLCEQIYNDWTIVNLIIGHIQKQDTKI